MPVDIVAEVPLTELSLTTACTKTAIPARNVTVVAIVGINFLHAAKF
jgi:hypothetical protein